MFRVSSASSVSTSGLIKLESSALFPLRKHSSSGKALTLHSANDCAEITVIHQNKCWKNCKQSRGCLALHYLLLRTLQTLLSHEESTISQLHPEASIRSHSVKSIFVAILGGMAMNIHIPLLSSTHTLMCFSSSSQTLQPGLGSHQAPHLLPTTRLSIEQTQSTEDQTGDLPMKTV